MSVKSSHPYSWIHKFVIKIATMHFKLLNIVNNYVVLWPLPPAFSLSHVMFVPLKIKLDNCCSE